MARVIFTACTANDQDTNLKDGTAIATNYYKPEYTAVFLLAQTCHENQICVAIRLSGELIVLHSCWLGELRACEMSPYSTEAGRGGGGVGGRERGLLVRCVGIRVCGELVVLRYAGRGRLLAR